MSGGIEGIARLTLFLLLFIIGSIAYANFIGWNLLYDVISKGEVISSVFWPAVICIERPFSNLKDLDFFSKISPTFSINNIKYKNRALPKIVPLFDMYRWTELKPFNQFGIISEFNGLEMFIDMDLKVEPSNYIVKTDETNIPIPQGAFYNLPLDMNFPRCGYIRYSNKNLFVQLGRTKLRWGPSEFPMVISNSSPYFDNFSFSQKIDFAESKSLTYSYSLISIDPDLTATESSLQSRNAVSNVIYNEPAKTLVAHRLDLKLFRNFRIGVGELNLVGGKHPNLQDISPFIIFHNIYSPHYQNVIGSLDFSWTMIPNLMVYGELAFDDIRLPSEPKDSPLEYGISFGSRFTSRIFEGKFMGDVEYSHTSNWMYNCRAQPYLKFTNRIVMFSNFPSGMNFFDYPIGFKYGQGADMFSITSEYFGKVLNLKGQLILLRKGNLSFEDYYTKEIKNVFTNHVFCDFGGTIRNLFFKNLNFFANLHLHFPSDGNMETDLHFGFEYSMILKDITKLFSHFFDQR